MPDTMLTRIQNADTNTHFKQHYNST